MMEAGKTKDLPFDVAFPEIDVAAANAAVERWNSLAKPPASLGLLEKAVVKIAGLTGDPGYALNRRVLLVLCADNGVVSRGVTQVGSEVTAALARCSARGNISVCKMAEVAGADVVGVDMGMAEDLRLPELLDRRIAAGTADLGAGSAMTREQALQAIRHGIDLAKAMRDKGYAILLTGEVGMGNTTTSSAMASVLLGRNPAEMTGRGAGLSDAGLQRKIAVIEEAVAVNKPDPDDALDVLAKLGGFDIAGMTGIFLGGAMFRIPVLIDGLISSVAALVAERLCPGATRAMLASHVSAEPAGALVLDELALHPLIHAGLCLGEGTGAVAALALLDQAYAVYNNMITYGEIPT